MSGIKSVCVYCGSSNDADPAYIELAQELGRAIAKRGWRLVYGGGTVGLMFAAAEAAHKAGGEVLGIIPQFLQRIEGNYDDVPHIVVETMHERKKMLLDESEAFVVLPGGIGTLEEAVETLSWAKLSLHAKPMGFLSKNEYWTPFFECLEKMVEHKFAPESMLDLVFKSDDPEYTLDEFLNRFVDVG
ncbi:LOG family protein [Hirschia maritima]|uniref:LOG family protein n=1 Tax=Hirschia maritima TaxID=1121961 RepID=UPI00036A2ACB|nr:TIGR00730 family Rossman fold protein [Hirschia maritima]